MTRPAPMTGPALMTGPAPMSGPARSPLDRRTAMSVLSPEPPPRLVTPDSPTTLRLLPVPVSEPPYDDEVEASGGEQSSRPLGPLRTHARLSLVPDLDEEQQSRRSTPLGDLPPARPVAHALVQGLLEVLAGVRPVKQLRGTTTLEMYDRLEQHLRSTPRPTGARPGGGAVRSLHLQERPEGVVEICATVHRGLRPSALALRMEGVNGRWACTQLDGL